jgi:hypothetical protein
MDPPASQRSSDLADPERSGPPVSCAWSSPTNRRPLWQPPKNWVQTLVPFSLAVDMGDRQLLP